MRTLLLVLALAACGDTKTPPAEQTIVTAQDLLAAPPDVAAPPADAEKTASGLASKVLKAGTGTEHPKSRDVVTVHYTGWTTDGERFDSSVQRGTPATFALNQVIAGWTEGLQLMVVGEKRRFWIPVELAYQNRPGKPKGMLVFDVELLSYEKSPEPPPAPPDVAAPPADAVVSKTGVAKKVLTPGTGTVHPLETDMVTLHFSGWTTDGEIIDSSLMGGKPITIPVNKVNAGWTEALQTMVVGEKCRLWIPEEMGFKGQPGAPAGMLVFEMELLGIQTPPKAPKDVAGPPKDAQTTPSGLAFKVLKPGEGGRQPKATDMVSVQYSGWTTDGKMFDSSVMRGEAAEFTLNQVIPGWTEGVQLMTKGEKRIFWIPESLAYNGRPGKPKGMLVFEVELVDIK